MTCARILLFTIACCSLSGLTRAATIQITQGGWDRGGPLTVVLSGKDSNHNGAIDQSELTAFSAVYNLPQGGSTTWLLADLEPDGFMFSGIADYLMFATNASYTLLDSAFHGAVRGSVVDAFLFPIDVTGDLPTAVPEPSPLGCFAAAVVLLACNRSQHSTRPYRR